MGWRQRCGADAAPARGPLGAANVGPRDPTAYARRPEPRRPPFPSMSRPREPQPIDQVAIFLRLLGLAAAGLLVVVAGLALVVLGRSLGRSEPRLVLDPDAAPRAIQQREGLATTETDNIALFQRAGPSVVHIDTSRGELGTGLLDVLSDMPDGIGSGVLWDEQGYVVTNWHVVREAASSIIRLEDGSEWKAVLIGTAPDYDLAVLKIDAPADRLTPIDLGTSSDLRVGQRALAIGYPFGLDQTLTEGIVSGLDRTIRGPEGNLVGGLIQTDAAINPGNSGGPLLDSAGRMIGVNTALVSPTGVYSGVGFAVPVDLVNRIVPRILATGSAPRPGLGILLAPDELARRFGFQGALISGVLGGSPAERAELRPTMAYADGRVQLGDVIVSVDEMVISNRMELQTALSRFEVGQRVRLGILRGTERLNVEVELGSLDAGGG